MSVLSDIFRHFNMDAGIAAPCSYGIIHPRLYHAAKFITAPARAVVIPSAKLKNSLSIPSAPHQNSKKPINPIISAICFLFLMLISFSPFIARHSVSAAYRVRPTRPAIPHTAFYLLDLI